MNSPHSPRRHWGRAAALLGIVLCLAAAAVWAQSDHPPPGHTRSLAVPRTAVPPVIDGRLDDAVWKSAARATQFWVSEYNRPPHEPTEVWVLADDKALYFAFVCHDSRPEEIHAEQLKRDGDLDKDDHVIVQLDPYHNHRQISEFAVNARGTQSDAMAEGRARKIEWKGDWQGAAQRTADGWTAEMAIPYAILKFQHGTHTFGVNFVRYHLRTQEWSRWADVTTQSLAEEAGHLTALLPGTSPQAKKITVMQYAAAGRHTLGKRGDIQDTLATTGFDLRYDIARNLSSVLSLNPDFSQVENDVLDLAFDYNEKFLADHRPFFQEGSAFFGDRSYFYSGRLPNFDLGVKSFGKIGALQLGLLGLQAPGGRRDYVARVLREFGPTVNAALTFVGTERPDFDNRLLALQARGRWRRHLTFDADLATTSTVGGGTESGSGASGLRPSGDGTRLGFALGHQIPYWKAGVGYDRTDDGFFPANGFIAGDQPGTRGGKAYLSYYREYGGGRFRNLNGTLAYAERETLAGLTQSRKLTASIGGETRSNTYFELGMSQGPYRPRKKKTGEWASQLNDDRFYYASLFFDTRSDRHGYGLTYSWGFLGGGNYSDLAPSFWLKPTRRTYVSYSYERASSFGLRTQNILSLSWEMSPEQALSARWVQSGGHSYRLAYRRQVRRGLDIFAVFDQDPGSPDRFTVKLVRSFSPHWGF